MSDEKTTTAPNQPGALTSTTPVVLSPLKERDEWLLIKDQARIALASGLLPKHITKPEQAAIIALKGRELGIPIMQALSSISVINGKPALSAELMLALIYKRIKGVKIAFTAPVEKQNEYCEVTFQRPGGAPHTIRFTIEDARRAGLLSNPSWAKYPAAMLRARCISAMARIAAPDALMGCYTQEELGGEAEEHDDAPYYVKDEREAPAPSRPAPDEVDADSGGQEELKKELITVDRLKRFTKPKE